MLNLHRGFKHGGATEAVTDQQCWCSVVVTHEFRRGKYVCNIRGEVALREIALTIAKPGKIESEYCDAAFRQQAAYSKHGDGIFGAGKAVAGNGVCSGYAGGQLESCIEIKTATTNKSRFNCS